jgi:hypothetical protein
MCAECETGIQVITCNSTFLAVNRVDIPKAATFSALSAYFRITACFEILGLGMFVIDTHDQ